MEYLRPLQRTGDASLLAYGHAERDGHIAFATAYLAGAPNVHSGGFDAAPLAPAHARCTALAYKLLDAQ